MNNIFENAYFGKPYKTRDGKKALYGDYNKVSDTHTLMVIVNESEQLYYNSDGTYWSPKCPNLDIVSEWQEEIDEEELDRLAGEYADSILGEHREFKAMFERIFKAGYRKALQQ